MKFVSDVVQKVMGKRQDSNGFDPNFYRQKYKDLAGFVTDIELINHYRLHGQQEGRYISLHDARQRLHRIGRSLPPDFDPSTYANMNPDIGGEFHEEWQFELHYLEFGQVTGRPYLQNKIAQMGSVSSDSKLFDPDFYVSYYQDLRGFARQAAIDHFIEYGEGEGRYRNLQDARNGLKKKDYVLPLDFNATEYAALNKCIVGSLTEQWQLELHYALNSERMDLPYKVVPCVGGTEKWKEIFVAYDYCCFQSNRCLDRAVAIKRFEQQGIDKLAPIARHWYFDPVFYRNNYGMAIESDADLYRHWLRIGVALGRAPNECRAIAPLVGEDSFYPDAFDWKSFSTVEEDIHSVYPTKIDALFLLFKSPLDENAEKSISGPHASDLYRKIADWHLIRGDYITAMLCYDRIAEADLSASALTRKGDALRGLGRVSDALSSYRRAMSFPAYSIWALVHYAKMSIDTGQHLAAFQRLEAERLRWGGSPIYRSSVDECIELRHAQISDAAWKLISSGDVSHANDLVATELPQLTEVIRKLKIHQGLSINNETRRVVILACLDLPQCTHYRVSQRVEQLGYYGFNVEIFDQKDIGRFMFSLPGARAAIFYRIPALPKVIESILYARSLGIITFYDIDDLIFTEDFPEDFESYQDQISFDVFKSLNHGVPYFRHAISLCDVGIASTEPLAARLKEFVRSQEAVVIVNGLATETIRLAELLSTRSKLPCDTLRIFYGSGTKAHNRDFNVILGSVLIYILKTYRHVNLTIVGYLALGPEFDAFESRICRIGFIEERSEYLAMLAACHINISVLSGGPIADCKSEIKWLEASVFRVPTVVSYTQTFQEVLNPPKDGFIARSAADWIRFLSQLIESSELRESVGTAAYRRVVDSYNPRKVGGALVAAFDKYCRRYVGPNDPRRDGIPHVLICNVFFAPQSYGGATRVVEANVNYFLEHCSTAFNFSILATDDGMPPGSFLCDMYRGITVYRIGTQYEENMDWRPFNEQNVRIYRKILGLDKPDLVHFHCIQRLTASLVQETLDQGIPYLITVHDAWWISDYQFLFDDDNSVALHNADIFKTPLPSGVTRSQSVSRHQRLGALINSARSTLAVSESFGDLCREAGIRNVRVVPNGIGPLPPKLPTSARPDKLVLGHIGGRSVHKGSTLLEIVLRQSAFENLELIMVDGRIEAGEEVRTFWGKTAVLLQGFHPQDRVNELFASFDVLVAPSIWPESFGLVSREGVFYGKWVITSTLGAISGDIVNGVNGFVIEAGSAKELKAVLQNLNDDFSRFKREPQRAQLRSADDQARELISIYRSVILQPTSETGSSVKAMKVVHSKHPA